MSKLGRGLDALIDSGPEAIDKTTGITTVKVAFIKPNRFQPRKVFKEDKLRELAKSLQENGLIQPIIVTKKDRSEYELIAGERRLEAARIAGFDEIPVIIRSVSPREQLQFAIIENIQREDLNAIEEAIAFHQLSEDFGLTHSQISEIIGKERTTISNSIRLLKLNENIKQMVLDGKLSSGHARAILQVDEKLQEEFANYIVENSLSVRKAESDAKRIRETGSVQKINEEITENSKIYHLEERLNNIFKVKVRISGKNNKGKITFFYSSKEEFDQLLSGFEKK